MTQLGKKTVCVDLDDVLAVYDGWKGLDHIGEPFPGAVEFMHNLREFARVVVHTTRCSPRANPRANLTPLQLRAKVTAWLDEWRIPYDEVWASPGKPKARAYIDDKAVLCDPKRSVQQPDLGYSSVTQRCRELVCRHRGERNR